MRPSENEIAEWVVRTCLLFGTTVEVAYHVAALFIEGLNSGRHNDGTPARSR